MLSGSKFQSLLFNSKLFGYIKDMISLEMEKDLELEATFPTNVRNNLITDINSCGPPPPKKS